MEVLIELVVWVLRSLFGDPEKPADVNKPRGNVKQTPSARGPYNYGDQPGNAPSSGRPKTLEEILEEVRQQAAKKKQPEVRSAEVRPKRVRIEGAPSMPPKPASRPWAEQQETEPKPVGTLTPVPPPPPPAPPPQAVQEMPSQTRAAEVRAAEKQQLRRPAGEQSARPQRRKMVRAEDAPQIAALSSVDFIHAIKASPPAAKRIAARQAIVLAEVFGPPRARRPFKPGGLMHTISKQSHESK
jgi:hypothetical protein